MVRRVRRVLRSKGERLIRRTRSYLLTATVGAGCHVTPVSSMTIVRGPSAPSLRNGPSDLWSVVGAVGVEELHGAGAEDLEAVVEVGAGGEGLGAEAGAGIVDFEEFDGVGGAVADRGYDVWGVAAGGGDEGEDCEKRDAAHESQEYQAVWGCGWEGSGLTPQIRAIFAGLEACAPSRSKSEMRGFFASLRMTSGGVVASLPVVRKEMR